jgi:hypothetical protein
MKDSCGSNDSYTVTRKMEMHHGEIRNECFITFLAVTRTFIKVILIVSTGSSKMKVEWTLHVDLCESLDHSHVHPCTALIRAQIA